ncbi:Uncharacterised protein [Mycobacteroides abscessus subsp. abscessus]|nr:Uncharacterised protein [Mycobacteroides abscessus subsp. abscessus]
MAGRGFDGVAGFAQLARDRLRRDRRHVGVFPGVTAEFHPGLHYSLGTRRVALHLIADLEEGGVRAVGPQNGQQPIGEGAGPVVERQRDTLLALAVHRLGEGALLVGDDDRGRDQTSHRGRDHGPTKDVTLG